MENRRVTPEEVALRLMGVFEKNGTYKSDGQLYEKGEFRIDLPPGWHPIRRRIRGRMNVDIHVHLEGGKSSMIVAIRKKL